MAHIQPVPRRRPQSRRACDHCDGPAEAVPARPSDVWEDIYWSSGTAEVLDCNGPTVPWEEAITELEIGDARTGARSSR